MRGALLLSLAALVAATQARAAEPAEGPRQAAPASVETVVDRVVVRFVTAETGGIAHPRFLSERQVALFARLEAHVDGSPLDGPEYPERYVRVAVDRLVARAMLASLAVQQGREPPELPRRTAEARAELVERLGGEAALLRALAAEGIREAELTSMLRELARASWYVDRVFSPLFALTEDALREAFRAAPHPFRVGKFEEVRERLRLWVVAERMRTAELEFLQGVRARIQITPVQ